MKKIIPLSLLGVAIIMAIMPHKTNITKKKVQSKRIVLETKSVSRIKTQVIEENAQNNENIVQNSYETRMTSYYPSEDTDCTGCGLCSWDFQVNENGWYTYNGKLVVATATDYLLKYGFTLYDGVHTRRYYDELTLNIDGIDYQAIVLDSCGNCMRTDRVDLFVSNAWAVKDTQIIVKE